MTFRWPSYILLFSLLPSIASPDSLDFNLNDDAARALFVKTLPNGSLQVDGGWLHHQDRGDVLNIGLHLSGLASSGQNPVRAGIGVELFYADADTADGGALGLGGFFHYTLPNIDRFGIGGRLYFAPDVLGFGDLEQYSEASVYASYNVLREADVYLGVRHVGADFDQNRDVTFDTGVHIGVHLEF